MNDHRDDNDRAPCLLCEHQETRPGHIYCDRCSLRVFRIIVTALGRTALRLIPEAAALAIILLLLPAIGHPHSWLTIPVLCVGIPRAWWMVGKQTERVAHEYVHRYSHVRHAQGYVLELQKGKAEFDEELRREIAARSIPISPELDEALHGRRHPDDLPAADQAAILPAVEAVVKRRRQREDAYGIEAGLPHGTDAVC